MSVAGSIGRGPGRYLAIAALVVGVVGGGTIAADAAVTSGSGGGAAGAAPPVEAGSAQGVSGAPLTVATGLRVPRGELLLTVRPVEAAELPETRFGLMLGLRGADGTIEDLIATNETSGSDVAPGFHAVQAPTTVDGVEAPEFGYYAGPAAKITGVTNSGGTVEAGLGEVEIHGTRIVLFWFDAASTGPCPEVDRSAPEPDLTACDVTGLAAFDASGAALPAGNSADPGHG